jgi:hypothetical protein
VVLAALALAPATYRLIDSGSWTEPALSFRPTESSEDTVFQYLLEARIELALSCLLFDHSSPRLFVYIPTSVGFFLNRGSVVEAQYPWPRDYELRSSRRKNQQVPLMLVFDYELMMSGSCANVVSQSDLAQSPLRQNPKSKRDSEKVN